MMLILGVDKSANLHADAPAPRNDNNVATTTTILQEAATRQHSWEYYT